MNTARVDHLIQYALAVASENDWIDRELGPIHLIKYVYLADLDYASRNNGQTYTGLNWQFFRFGPWTSEVLNRIEPALVSIAAEKKIIQSDKFDDFVRWKCNNPSLIDDIEASIDTLTALAVKAAVRTHGKDTESLLHHVYKTSPMVNAAPNELLDFSFAVFERPAAREELCVESGLSIKQAKKRKAKIENIKKGFHERFAKKKAKQESRSSKQPEPRYDAVFFEGVEALEKLAGEEIKTGKMTCSFNDDYWKSKARYDPELP